MTPERMRYMAQIGEDEQEVRDDIKLLKYKIKMDKSIIRQALTEWAELTIQRTELFEVNPLNTIKCYYLREKMNLLINLALAKRHQVRKNQKVLKSLKRQLPRRNRMSKAEDKSNDTWGTHVHADRPGQAWGVLINY